jgi:anti-anti-sigma factor
MPQPSRLLLAETGERVLAASGIIDSHTAAELLKRIRAFGTDADVILDMAKVEFIDSSGLRTVVSAHQDFDDVEHQMRLANPSDAVQRLLEITGLIDHLHLGE